MRGLAAGLALAAVLSSGAARAEETRQAALARLAAQAEQRGETVLAGKHGWLFLVQELRHLGAGRYWGADAARASRAAQPERADPLPAILDFRDQLEKAGVELLLVPVPARAAVVPGELPGLAAAPEGRLDQADAEFHALLREKGVDVLDLQPEFQAAGSERPAVCRTDTHWSGTGLEIAAARIAERVRKLPWYAGVPKRRFVSESRETEFRGDLLRMIGDAAPPPERLALRFVTREGAPDEPVAPDPKSPLLLLSDSHGLVFGAGGDLHARGAGLPDQLALELGVAVDLVAVRGSPSNAGRMQLARRKDAVAGKRIVIWVFGARYFTDQQGWAKVPVVR
jgi:alginate O-acetyltransferase complex protein AlgJ